MDNIYCDVMYDVINMTKHFYNEKDKLTKKVRNKWAKIQYLTKKGSNKGIKILL